MRCQDGGEEGLAANAPQRAHGHQAGPPAIGDGVQLPTHYFCHCGRGGSPTRSVHLVEGHNQAPALLQHLGGYGKVAAGEAIGAPLEP